MMGVVERFADSEFVGNKLVVSYRQNDRFLPTINYYLIVSMTGMRSDL